jgi:hypothetical protein
MAITKRKLSESTNGKNIKIAATATPGTLVHTAYSGEDGFDEIFIDVVNTSGAGVKVTVEWGEATAPDGNIEYTVPGEDGPYRIISGWLLQNGLTVKIFAGTTNVIVVNGYVNRIIQ